ncbi:hypothetical protein [Methylobacterium oryzisoli]|uniref:hypothetical protein n=1 Tax=Methylobacterium oryzisoli TaxID=3385502 RepID=UPI0038922301
METLRRRYCSAGFVVLIFPRNQFGAQEPGAADCGKLGGSRLGSDHISHSSPPLLRVRRPATRWRSSTASHWYVHVTRPYSHQPHVPVTLSQYALGTKGCLPR